jgi:uncharacterized membrane protein
MAAQDTVFAHTAFWVLVALSTMLPFVLYAVLLRRRSVSPWTVLVFGLILVLIAGIDVYLLRVLGHAARLTASRADDAVFISEISAALYLLPALFGGIGVNLISHVLVRHLIGAERDFERRHPTP